MNYPLLLTPRFWKKRPVLVVGGGRVAERRTLALLDAGASVTIISPDLTPALAARQADFTWLARRWQLGDISLGLGLNGLLVFAATNDKEVNQTILKFGRIQGKLVNVADDPAQSDFIVPGVVRRGPLTFTIDTGGTSPALTAHLVRRLDAAIGPEYEELALTLAKLRPTVQAKIPAEQRATLWQALIESEALEEFRRGQPTLARRLLRNLVKEAERAGGGISATQE